MPWEKGHFEAFVTGGRLGASDEENGHRVGACSGYRHRAGPPVNVHSASPVLRHFVAAGHLDDLFG